MNNQSDNQIKTSFTNNSETCNANNNPTSQNNKDPCLSVFKQYVAKDNKPFAFTE